MIKVSRPLKNGQFWGAQDPQNPPFFAKFWAFWAEGNSITFAKMDPFPKIGPQILGYPQNWGPPKKWGHPQNLGHPQIWSDLDFWPDPDFGVTPDFELTSKFGVHPKIWPHPDFWPDLDFGVTQILSWPPNLGSIPKSDPGLSRFGPPKCPDLGSKTPKWPLFGKNGHFDQNRQKCPKWPKRPNPAFPSKWPLFPR